MNASTAPIHLPWFFWLLIFSLLLAQAIWVYLDAQKRGHNKWLWGLFCLLNVPTNGLVYLFVTRWMRSKDARKLNALKSHNDKKKWSR